ncbi:hypothetical protein LMG28138_05010 [Pararobbsia alpina]|uniref:Uncharacterized protein n=1 Tax=Pararobbsia alpina TaxID=621374 RepID=A0A6S7BWK8_9BURK|nr:hypothetical protein LMG28138_05010 [Pararobbsia alpina]
MVPVALRMRSRDLPLPQALRYRARFVPHQGSSMFKQEVVYQVGASSAGDVAIADLVSAVIEQ